MGIFDGQNLSGQIYFFVNKYFYLFMNQTVIIAFISASLCSAILNRYLKVDYKFESYRRKNIKFVIPDGLRNLTKDLVIRQCTND